MLDNRIEVDQELIKKYLKADRKPYSIAKFLKIPISVVEGIQAGKDRPYYKKRKKKKTENMCEACGMREKGEGLRFLCDRCFALNSEKRKSIA